MPRLRTLWKSWDDDGVGCIAAMDDEVTANDWERWVQMCDDALKVYGTEDTREVLIDVPYAPIAALFAPATVQATVAPPSGDKQP